MALPADRSLAEDTAAVEPAAEEDIEGPQTAAVVAVVDAERQVEVELPLILQPRPLLPLAGHSTAAIADATGLAALLQSEASSFAAAEVAAVEQLVHRSRSLNSRPVLR